MTVRADASTGSEQGNTLANTGIIDASNPAVITFHPQSFIATTSSSFYQVTQPGYNTAYLQVALHEIGHLMGMQDYPTGAQPAPGPTTSVVAPTIGVNDQGNQYQKTGPTSCDIQQAASVTQAMAIASAGSGGGGNGSGESGGDGGSSGGGGGDACNDTQYWDEDTNTLMDIRC